MKLGISIDDGMYGVKGGKCVGCGKETRHLYKHTKFPKHQARCSRCMDELKDEKKRTSY
ncbi:hypothetical protein [Paenibacillus sp. FSL A5-0031]|uniref:hypothetical protein n=1 Tax=Paenibacillus sp. FSL A5-0031 TaxID=1920420 RepID=UPI0015C32388|nr:hypothetical protein [Paenibacillus sp. FSL A5-0031]